MENDILVAQVSEAVQDTAAVADLADRVKMLTNSPVSERLPYLINEYVIPFGFKLVVAILVLLLGLWAIKLVKKWMSKRPLSRRGDATLGSFLSNLVSVLLYFLLIIAVIGIWVSTPPLW